MKIKDWAVEDRPIEKMMAKGSDALSNAELLAILLRSGTHDKTAVELAQEIMTDCNNSLIELGRLSLKGHQKYKGLGEMKVASIIAALELGKRKALQEESADNEVMKSSDDLYRYFHHRLASLPHEELWALYLSKGHKILHSERISQGGTDFSGADVKMIVRPALQFLSSAVVLCHNHPHGNARPSGPDLDITRKVEEALRLFDIRLLDHIIISDNDYYSFVDNGNL